MNKFIKCLAFALLLVIISGSLPSMFHSEVSAAREEGVRNPSDEIRRYEKSIREEEQRQKEREEAQRKEFEGKSCGEKVIGLAVLLIGVVIAYSWFGIVGLIIGIAAVYSYLKGLF